MMKKPEKKSGPTLFKEAKAHMFKQMVEERDRLKSHWWKEQGQMQFYHWLLKRYDSAVERHEKGVA